MNKPKTISSTDRVDLSTEVLLKNADLLVSQFERLLASELQLLKTGKEEGLEAIAAAKQSLVEKISLEESGLIDLFRTQHQNSEVERLKQRLQQCRVDNKSNHALVMLELKHTNKSLELLRSILNMDDLPLYSERGKVRVKREKRRFGSA